MTSEDRDVLTGGDGDVLTGGDRDVLTSENGDVLTWGRFVLTGYHGVPFDHAKH